MENQSSKVECNNCHKLVDIPFDKKAIYCPHCNAIIVVYEQILPPEAKNTSISENKVSDK